MDKIRTRLKVAIILLVSSLVLFSNCSHEVVKQVSADPIKYCGYGANETVSGSMHIIEMNNMKIMLDAGSFYGKDGVEEQRYDKALVDSLSCIIISHVHIDHIGNLIKILNQGYQGNIYCSEPAKELMPVMLRMASKYGSYGKETFYYSKLNEGKYKNIAVHRLKDCKYGSRIREDNLKEIDTARDKLAEKGFYLCGECVNEEVNNVMKRVCTIPLNREYRIGREIDVKFYLTPHIPGSVMVKLIDNAAGKTLLYTGDVGSGLSPFLPKQQYPTGIDYLILEATYGTKIEERDPNKRIRFRQQIGEYIKQGRRVIIPAFVLDRSQQILYELTKAKAANIISPQTSIKVIGSSVAQINNIYQNNFREPKFSKYFSKTYRAEGPFGPGFIEFKSGINKAKIGYGQIAIVSSGMANASYAKEFVEEWYADPKTVFVFVGYQDPETPGGELTADAKTLTIDNVKKQVKAEVAKFSCFSGHGNFNEISKIVARGKGVKEVLIVHLNHYDTEKVQKAYEKRFPKIKFHVPKYKEAYFFTK